MAISSRCLCDISWRYDIDVEVFAIALLLMLSSEVLSYRLRISWFDKGVRVAINVAVRDPRWKDLIELVAGHLRGGSDPANQRTVACLQRIATSADLTDLAYVRPLTTTTFIIIFIIVIIRGRYPLLKSHSRIFLINCIHRLWWMYSKTVVHKISWKKFLTKQHYCKRYSNYSIYLINFQHSCTMTETCH